MKHLNLFEGWKNEPESDGYWETRKYIDILKSGRKLNSSQKLYLDTFFNHKKIYKSAEDLLKRSFEIISRYDYDDVEDRLIEFYDQIPEWVPRMMFATHMKYEGGESWSGIDSKKISDPKYFLFEMGHVLSDLLYCSRKISPVTVNSYLENQKPCITISLNPSTENHRSSYNLKFIEGLTDNVVKRLRSLYKITEVTYDVTRSENRRFDTNMEIYDYTFTLTIE